MDIVDAFMERAKRKPGRIVYPEAGDARIVQTAARVKELGIAEPILLGNREGIEKAAWKAGVSLEGIRSVSPREGTRAQDYAKRYAAARGLSEGVAMRLMRKPLFFGGMMVAVGEADGMVGGITRPTAAVIRSAVLTVGLQKDVRTPSSFFVMVVPQYGGEKDKPFVFADCGVAISPNARQLAEIGVQAGRNAKLLLGEDPRIAFLSFSTKGSASHADVDKVVEAVKIAREMAPDLAIDGDLQGDAALAPSVAAKKVKESPVAGRANVLVFPDLDAGNIGYKLVQYLANAVALGPILQGFAKPVNDLSRGATVEDVVGITAITVIQGQGAL